MKAADKLTDLPQGLGHLLTGDPDGIKSYPVERWNPEFCGDLDIRIKQDGTWYYLGSPIKRERMIRLFSAVLRKDADGRTYLVTPVEKIGITVDDAPFVGVDIIAKQQEGQQILYVRTNVGEVVRVDAARPMRFSLAREHAGFKPYCLVRGRLEALLNRSTAIQLANYIEVRHKQTGIASAGEFFPIDPAMI